MEIDTINNYYVEGTKTDLERATKMIKAIREVVNIDSVQTMSIADKLNHKIKTEVVLYAVSDMSIPLTKKHDTMRTEYQKKYDNKKDAQNFFLKKYYAMHKPYDRIKSLCWKTLFTLDGLDENGEEIKKTEECLAV
jgi:hypothetical protein